MPRETSNKGQARQRHSTGVTTQADVDWTIGHIGDLDLSHSISGQSFFSLFPFLQTKCFPHDPCASNPVIIKAQEFQTS